MYHLIRVSDFIFMHFSNYPSSMKSGKARVAVLFSGGIDSTVIAYLAHRCVGLYAFPLLLIYCRHIPLDQPIDLLNVAFENPRKIKIQQEGNIGGTSRRSTKSKPESKGNNTHTLYEVPDRITGTTEVEELRRLCPGRTWNFVCLVHVESLILLTGLGGSQRSLQGSPTFSDFALN